MKILYIVNENGEFFDKLDGEYNVVDSIDFDEEGNLPYAIGFSDNPDGYAVAKVMAYDNMGAIIRFDTEDPDKWEILEDHRDIPKFSVIVGVWKGIIDGDSIKIFNTEKEALEYWHKTYPELGKYEDYVKLERESDILIFSNIILENIPYYVLEE